MSGMCLYVSYMTYCCGNGGGRKAKTAAAAGGLVPVAEDWSIYNGIGVLVPEGKSGKL